MVEVSSGIMKKTIADWRRRLVLMAILCSATALLMFVFGNLFPDPTWRAKNTVRGLYAEIVSHLTPLPTGADRAAQEENIRVTVFLDMIGSKGTTRLFFPQNR